MKYWFNKMVMQLETGARAKCGVDKMLITFILPILILYARFDLDLEVLPVTVSVISTLSCELVYHFKFFMELHFYIFMYVHILYIFMTTVCSFKMPDCLMCANKL